jgi:hypothetical protein
LRPVEWEGGGMSQLASTLDDVADFVRRFVVLGEAERDALALWVAHTHAIEAADATPYIAVTSPEPESGKSLTLDVLALLVREPLPTVNISDAALFRAVHELKPSLLMDEMDAVFGQRAREREELRGLLNSGYRRGQTVVRMGGAKMDKLQRFELFCPKVFAGLGELPETIRSRSIIIRLQRRARDEHIEGFRYRDAAEAARPIFRSLVALAAQHTDELREARPSMPDELGDRARDTWEPLLAIADHAGGAWPSRARAGALRLSAAKPPDEYSRGVELLAAVRSAFETTGADRLSTARLIEVLAADAESPWADWGGSGAIPPRSLASLLRRYGIRSGTIRLPGESTPKGYKREQFAEAWKRYLPAASDVHSAPIRHNATTGIVGPDTSESQSPQMPLVADPGLPADAHAEAVVAGVADRRQVPGDSGFRELLNRAFEAGHITERERHERRLLHDLIVRSSGFEEAA